MRRFEFVRRSQMALVVGGVGAVVLAGCGGGSSGPKDNGVSAKTAQQILDAATAAVASKGTVHAAGSRSAGGQTVSLDVHLDSTHDSATGFVTVNGDRLDLVRIGTTLYIKASPSLLQKQGATAAQASLLGNKWLKSTTTSANFAVIADFTSANALIKPSGTIAKGATSTVDGQKVIALHDEKDGSDVGTLYVRTTGDPLPVEITAAGSASGALKFSDFGVAVNATAPAGALDLSQLGGG